ncbi:glycerol-3-phosphate responsive antiterminator [Arthrobacter sp. Helios]|uniref:glycerol-3-phosphate responsive antiterminator n=1 Tax=Arthrobacter sp. Helios TaxID=2828862 RepID=UPI00204F9E97|nr:glycerol-3-phosphate responsive antiterminator [Arthrobacter sp. Helios]UPO76787.1 glycerol-3-phosphate responsive antiterminator [Arthrobacter sp. Helios]
MIDFPPELELHLARNPVIASVFGIEAVPGFLASDCRTCILAHLELHQLEGALRILDQAGKFTFVNIDACSGLGQDKGALEYLKKIGTKAIVSTRTSQIQRANQMGMVTMQKVFVTDRSNLPRSRSAIEQSKPHLVQLMPWPVVSHLSAGELAGLSPFIAAGFVLTAGDVATALKEGAKGISTSAAELWDLAVRRAPDAKPPTSATNTAKEHTL